MLGCRRLGGVLSFRRAVPSAWKLSKLRWQDRETSAMKMSAVKRHRHHCPGSDTVSNPRFGLTLFEPCFLDKQIELLHQWLNCAWKPAFPIFIRLKNYSFPRAVWKDRGGSRAAHLPGSVAASACVLRFIAGNAAACLLLSSCPPGQVGSSPSHWVDQLGLPMEK